MLRITKGKGFTVVELIVAMTILMILTAVAVPVVRVTIQRNKERELRHDLWEMRDAIDRYKDAADRGAFQIKLDSQGRREQCTPDLACYLVDVGFRQAAAVADAGEDAFETIGEGVEQGE